MEIVMVAEDKRLKIWRFDRREKKAEGHRHFATLARWLEHFPHAPF
jgi:hypothetical protein